ncbi:MAG: hypothetical protein ACFFD4_02335 [Candidatus Odinarchaeota archaeon]
MDDQQLINQIVEYYDNECRGKEKQIQDIINKNQNLPPGLLDTLIANLRTDFSSYSSGVIGLLGVLVGLMAVCLALTIALGEPLYLILFGFILFAALLIIPIYNRYKERSVIEIRTLTWLKHRNELSKAITKEEILNHEE